MSYTYTVAKTGPVNINVLQQQINTDAAIGVVCDDISYDSVNVYCDMESMLNVAQQTELSTVVANHNGKSKGFVVGLPVPLFDDFVSGSVPSSLGWMSTTGVSGGVSIGAMADQTHLGILQLTTGALAAGSSSLYLGLSDVVLGGGVLNMEFMVQVPALSQGANTYILRCGLGDQITGAFNNGLALEYDASQSTSWVAVAAKAGARTRVSTSVPVATGWRKFSFVTAADGLSADCYVDDVFVASLTSNLPVAACGPILQLTKTAGLVPALANIDYFYLQKQTNRTDFG